MSVSYICEIIPLPSGIFAEIQFLQGGASADLKAFFSRVPFLASLDHNNLVANKMKSGKPYLSVDQKYFGYSVSHTDNCYLLGINEQGEIGVDVERSNRKIHPNLRSRICHERDEWDQSTCTLQVWTIKEAVLKLIGTGLRLNMNKIVVERLDEINFQVHHDNKEISVVSLEYNGYWVSVAWTLI